MATWKKLGGQDDTNLGNSDLTVFGTTSRLLHLDSVSGSFEITNHQNRRLVKYLHNLIQYGNDESVLLHQFDTFDSSAEGGSGQGMSALFSSSQAEFRRCDSFIIQSNENDSSAEPRFILRRSNQDANVVDNDSLGQIDFQGRRTTGNNESYASIDVIARDVSAGTEDGELTLKVKSNGTSQPALSVKSLSQVSDVKSNAVEVYGQTLGGVVRDSQDEEFVVSGVACRDANGSNFVFGNAQYGIMAFNPSSSGTIKHFVVNFQSLLWPADFDDDDATFGLFKNGVSVATLSKNVFGEAANTLFSLDTSCDISYTASDNFEVKWTQDTCSNQCVLIGLSSSLTCRK